jgi:hypothetical protein
MADEFSWLADVPEVWEAPEDLLSPTRIPFNNLVLRVLASEMVGNDLIDLLGRLLSAHARVNMFFGTTGKSSLSLRDLALLSVRVQEVLRNVYLSWSAFSVEFSASNRRVGTAVEERRLFEEALRDGIAEIESMIS